MTCAALALGTAGCGNGQADQSTSEERDGGTLAGGPTEERKPSEGEREALTINAFNNLITEDFVSAFHQVYPEVELELISYAGTNGSAYAQSLLEHGDLPDIYLSTQNFSKESQEKYLLDLSNYDFVNNYSNALLDSQDINGSIYMLPSGYALIGIFYNKTIMEENQWEVPESFEELLELSKEIEEAGYQAVGNGMDLDGHAFSYFFNLGNTVYFDTPEGADWKEEFPRGAVDAAENDGIRRAAEYYCRWVENGFISEEHVSTKDFFAGKCVFYLSVGISSFEHAAENGKTYEIGIIPWLSQDGGNNMLTRNVNKYIGLNKALGEEGSEQKLEDALKLMSFVSSPEGQRALMANSYVYMWPLNDSRFSGANPYQEVMGLVNEGRTVPLVYVGWESLLVPIAHDLQKLIAGEITVDELPERFDETRNAVINGVSDDVYATAVERLTMEETARLAAIAEGKAVGADCALISLNEYHGNDLCNKSGLGWYLYEGPVDTGMINMIRPAAATISTLEMSGAEIKAMRDAGLDINENGMPYQFLLFTRGDMELEDDVLYKVAVSTKELTQDRLAAATETEVSPAEAIGAYLRELKLVDGESLIWD